MPGASRSFLTRFRRCQSGNMLIITAFSMLALLGAVGMAIDFGRATDNRDRMQHALDRSLLAAATGNLDDEERLKAEVEKSFHAVNTWGGNVSDITIGVKLKGDSLEAEASGTFHNSIMSMFGISSMPVGVTSQVTVGARDIEIALVLDNTGSMASANKIRILREAATDFVTKMEEFGEGRSHVNIRIGIVPFTTQVRVAATTRDASWLGFASPAIEAGWQGCIWDRLSSGFNRRDAHISIDGPGLDDLYPATLLSYNNGVTSVVDCSIAEILDLTDDYDAVRNRISEMRAIGNGFTNVGLGLVWGWNMLDPLAPLTAAEPFDDKGREKYIILLTDGENTFNRRAFNPNPHDPTRGNLAWGLLNKNTEESCTNIKATPIKVFTIRVVAGNQALLRSCATTESMYYNVTKADEMRDVFDSIGERIKAIHLSM